MSVFDFGTLTLDVELGPTDRTGDVAFDFGGLTLTAIGARKGIQWPGAALYDRDNQWICNLPLADGLKWHRALSDPGFLSLRLPVDDPATADASAGRWLKVFHRGQCRQAARITGSSVAVAVDGRRWLVFDLPGALDATADGCVLPEYGIGRTYSTTRTLGYMSVKGAWYRTGNWTLAEAVQYQADTGFRQFKPASLSFPNPYWISKRGPYVEEPAGAVQYVRHHFSTYTDVDWQILATADDYGEWWLDGEQIIAADVSQPKQWTGLTQVKGTFEPGLHVLAGKIRNSRRRGGPLAAILTLQQLKKNGDVVTSEHSLTRTSPFWFVSDVLPGFRKADVIRRMVFENRTYGIDVLTLMGLGFTVDRDSAGVEWDDDPDEYTFDVGAPLLDVFTTLAEKDLDLDVDPDSLTLLAYKRKGTDRRGVVQIATGSGGTGSIVDESIDRTEPRFTVALMQLADGHYVDREASTAGTYGRAVSAVSLGQARTTRQANRIADGLFVENANPTAAFTVRITDRAGPQPWRDLYGDGWFEEGDTISVMDQTGAYVPVRVLGIVGDYTGATGVFELEVVPDLSS